MSIDISIQLIYPVKWSVLGIESSLRFKSKLHITRVTFFVGVKVGESEMNATHVIYFLFFSGLHRRRGFDVMLLLWAFRMQCAFETFSCCSNTS